MLWFAMPFFAMFCSYSLLFACSKHCFLMLIPDMFVFSPSLWCWYLLHFCHASLNLLFCDLAVAQYSCFVKHLEYITAICFVVSDLSSQRCYHESIYVMLCFLLSLKLLITLAMFTWVPSYLLCLFGSWSVRNICSMHLVDSCHAFVCYDMFL